MLSSNAADEDYTDHYLDSNRIARLQVMLEETRLAILQQILAADEGALSVEEHAYRNPDRSAQTIDYHLRTLEEHDAEQSAALTLLVDEDFNRATESGTGRSLCRGLD